MKKQLLLLALMLGSQISAQTVKDVLDELNGSALEYFKIVNTTAVPEFQERNRSKLNTLLSQDINTVTLDQVEAIKCAIDSVVNAMSSSIKNVSPKYFSELAEETKEELQEVIEEVIQQAELQRLEEDMAQQKRLAEAALAQTIAAPTLSIDMMNAGDSTTDPIANPLLPTDRFPQLTEELSSLDETSSTDVDTVLLNHSDILEDFMNERMGNSTEQEYQDALGLFLKNKGIKIDDTILPGLATTLYNMQIMPDYHLEELDEEEEDMDLKLMALDVRYKAIHDALAAIELKFLAIPVHQITPEEIKNLAQEISGKDNQKGDTPTSDEVENYLVKLEQLDSKRTKERELRLLLTLEEKKKYYSDLFRSLDVTKTKPHPIIQMISARKSQTTQSLPSDYPADMEDVD